jgi:hypothetical protein
VSALYLDTCCIIYLVEASSPFHGVVVGRRGAMTRARWRRS